MEAKITDEEVLNSLLELLKTRVSITTMFAETGGVGNLTHQFLKIRCGDQEVISEPEELAVPLRLATLEETGATVH